MTILDLLFGKAALARRIEQSPHLATADQRSTHKDQTDPEVRAARLPSNLSGHILGAGRVVAQRAVLAEDPQIVAPRDRALRLRDRFLVGPAGRGLGASSAATTSASKPICRRLTLVASVDSLHQSAIYWTCGGR